MSKTKIAWTEEVWNPTTGCSRLSPGCARCYAFSLHDKRHEAYKNGKKLPEQYAKPFTELQLFPERLSIPLKRKKPTMWFVNSMSDLFHEDIPFEFIAKVYAVMASAERHIFQVLTKRPERAAEFQSWLESHWPTLFPHGEPDYPMESNVVLDFLSDEEAGCQVSSDNFPAPWPLPNLWLGTSVENQATANERIPHLLKIPAAVRFLSAEPLLGPIDLISCFEPDWDAFDEATFGMEGWEEPEDLIEECEEEFDWVNFGRNLVHSSEHKQWLHDRNRYARKLAFSRAIQWVICGGESGPGARPCDPEWIRSIRDQCKAASVSVFVKQLGANVVTRNDMVEDEFNGLNTGWPDPIVEHHIHGFREDYQGADCRVRLRDKKGGDISEWPEDLRLREYPDSAVFQ